MEDRGGSYIKCWGDTWEPSENIPKEFRDQFDILEEQHSTRDTEEVDLMKCGNCERPLNSGAMRRKATSFELKTVGGKICFDCLYHFGRRKSLPKFNLEALKEEQRNKKAELEQQQNDSVASEKDVPPEMPKGGDKGGDDILPTGRKRKSEDDNPVSRIDQLKKIKAKVQARKEASSADDKGISDSEASFGRCPSCHTNNDSDARFCKRCGISLRSDQQPSISCPSCGADLPRNLLGRKTTNVIKDFQKSIGSARVVNRDL
ncbi:hypothetical protein HDU85_006048 [Gaertneriomyces sp. JEL0708]|nr:hypothetical protein HDU85_006048 [Gaertneriomyces sp. JEL0708]